jgi:DNA-binding MarR family transcriptional regulator
MARRTQPLTEVVAEALSREGEATVDELAARVSISRSAIAKALRELEATGSARRSEGGRDGGRRLPDRWSPAGVKRAAKTRVASEREKLGKGVLGALVLAHLAGHPEEDHGPVGLAKALGGRSSGAVGNALQRLCDSGDAVLTSDAPRRYRIADGTAKQESAVAPHRTAKSSDRRTGAKAGAA